MKSQLVPFLLTQPEYMLPKPFIFVLGVPSGGTSCVALVLKQLGVDMGKVPNVNAPHGRNYSTVEDARFFAEVIHAHCTWGRSVPQSTAAATAAAVVRYVERRRANGSSSPALGCKCWVNWATTHNDFWRIPNLHVIRVHRPLEDCVRSFLSYQRRAAANTRRDLTRLSAYIAGLWTMTHQLQPSDSRTIELSYVELVDDPFVAVSRIARQLPIEISDSQIDNAIKHIRSPNTVPVV